MNIVDAIAEFENVFAMILEKTLQSDRRWPPFWSRDKHLDELLFQAYLKGLILERLPERHDATTSIKTYHLKMVTLRIMTKHDAERKEIKDFTQSKLPY